jgi:nitric oxide dioxygenase
MLPEMNPEQIALVKTSFAAATAEPGALASRFYARLFAAAPELQSLFTAEPAEQQRKLSLELLAIVERLDRVDDLVARTRDLGMRHVAYGARPAHYDVVGAALLGALGDVLGPRCTRELAAAWRYAYNLVAEALQQGAAEGAATRAGV